MDFLKRHGGEPCFVNLWPDDMHTPWIPNKEEQDRRPTEYESEANLKTVLKEYDRQIGLKMDGLKELGVAQNTLVIFTSDNGPCPTFDGKRTNHLRGSKFSLYEAGNQLPFIVHWPEKIPGGKVDTTTIISSTDLYPTLASIVGASMPSRYNFDGEDKKKGFFWGTSSPGRHPQWGLW